MLDLSDYFKTQLKVTKLPKQASLSSVLDSILAIWNYIFELELRQFGELGHRLTNPILRFWTLGTEGCI